jgi:hypothetical protein
MGSLYLPREAFMPKIKLFAAAVLCASLIPLSAVYAQGMSKGELKNHKARISEEYKADKEACHAHAGNAKDICEQEAKGKEKVARAEMAHQYSGKAADRNHVMVTQAKAAYLVAKERCDDLAGNAKDVCVKEAKAVEKKALADIGMGQHMGQAKNKAASEKLEADYKVALEKCNALAGDPKTNCVAAAKVTFGKK